MNGKIYDDTDWGNDSNLYSGNCNTGHGGTYDFCFDNDYSRRGSLPIDYMELPYRMDRMEEMLRDMCKKSKKHKRKKKKHPNGNQKLKKRLKTIEKQNAYIAGYLAAAMAQTQNTDNADKFAWLKNGFENSAPHIVDLVSNVVTGKRRSPTKTLNQPLYLPDKSSMK